MRHPAASDRSLGAPPRHAQEPVVASAVVPHAETIFEEMKRYVRFDDGDAALLVAFGVSASSQFGRIAEEFYDRIREHEGAHDVFTGEDQVERLKRSLVRWMGRVCSGTYDEAYYEETAKIGRMHVRVGLAQRYMFTAMTLIRLAFESIADASMGADAPRTRAAIAKVLHLELAIMLETYRDDFVARAQRIERVERAEVDRTLARTEHRYVQAVELAKIMVVGLDAQSCVQMFNHEAERVTGLGREEVIGRSFVEALLPAALRPEQGPVFTEIAAGKRAGAGVVESAIQTRAGTKWCSSRSARIRPARMRSRPGRARARSSPPWVRSRRASPTRSGTL
jgi:PAS domain S-box-containing protein